MIRGWKKKKEDEVIKGYVQPKKKYIAIMILHNYIASILHIQGIPIKKVIEL